MRPYTDTPPITTSPGHTPLTLSASLHSPHTSHLLPRLLADRLERPSIIPYRRLAPRIPRPHIRGRRPHRVVITPTYHAVLVDVLGIGVTPRVVLIDPTAVRVPSSRAATLLRGLLRLSAVCDIDDIILLLPSWGSFFLSFSPRSAASSCPSSPAPSRMRSRRRGRGPYRPVDGCWSAGAATTFA